MADRRERVILELQDDFTRQMAQAAAATAALKHELGGLSGTAVQTSRDTDRVQKSVKGVGDEVEKTSRKTRDGAKDIDRFSGRLRLLSEAAVVLGPALIPLGAAAIPAIAGLAAGFGAAAGAAGVAMLAFHGVGGALKALDTYQLAPTKDNLAKLREEMAKLGPAGAEFVHFLDGIEPQLRALQSVARAGLFPGVESGLSSLLDMLPQVRIIIFNVATELGRLSAEAGNALSGPGFSSFFNYLQSQAAPTLDAFAHTLGNVVEGFAHLVVAFGPLSGDFASGMERMSASFEKWAAGLSQTQGFHDFIGYLRETGPQVVELLGALGSAFVGILKAAAPVGHVVLPALTAMARVLGAIADSPIGPALYGTVAALIAFNRASSLASKALDAFGSSSLATTGKLTGMQKAATVAGLALAGLTVVDALQSHVDPAPGINQLTNDLNDLSSSAGGDLPKNLSNISAEIDRLANPSWAQGLQDKISNSLLGGAGNDSLHDNAVTQIQALDTALANIVNNQGAEAAKSALDALGKSANLSSSQMADLVSLLPNYNDAVAGVVGPTQDASAATRRLGLNAGLTRSQIDAMTQAMEQQASEAISAFDAVTKYAQAMAAARKRAKESSAGIDASTHAGQKNRDALVAWASAYNNQSDAVKNSLSKYAAARAAFINTAEAMGVASGKARKLADDMLNLPRFINVRVNAYTDQARSQIRAVLQDLATIPRSISTSVYVHRVNAINKGGANPNPDGSYANGGFTGRGGKYEPAGIVHRGEVVLPQEVVKRDWSMLRSRYGYLPGFADGGVVGSSTTAADQRDRSRQLKGLKASLDKLTKTLEKDKQTREDLIRQRQELRSGVASGLRSDIFGEQSNVWAAGTSPIAMLRSDIRTGREFTTLIKKLKAKGVHGAALAEIISTGDIQRARLMASMSRADLSTYERLYNTREQVDRQAGVAASQALGLDAHIDSVTREIKRLRGDVKHLQGLVHRADKANQKGHADNAAATRNDHKQTRDGHKRGKR